MNTKNASAKITANLRAMIGAANSPLAVERAKMALTTAAALGTMKTVDRFALLSEIEDVERRVRRAAA